MVESAFVEDLYIHEYIVAATEHVVLSYVTMIAFVCLILISSS